MRSDIIKVNGYIKRLKSDIHIAEKEKASKNETENVYENSFPSKSGLLIINFVAH